MRCCAVLLLALVLPLGPARAQEPQPLREFIDSFRSAKGRKVCELVLPGEPPVVPAGCRLVMEYRVGHYSVAEGVLRVAPVDDGAKVRVTRIHIGSYLPGFRKLAFRGVGVLYETAEIPRSEFDALVRDLLTIRDARLLLREGQDAKGGWAGTTADGALRLELSAGGMPLIGIDDALPIKGTRPGEVLGAFGDPERGLLSWARIEQRAKTWKLQRGSPPAEALATLLHELEAGKGDAVFRIQILGALGYKPAVACLKSIEARAEEDGKESRVRRWAVVALRQIEVLSASDPKPGLIELLDHPAPVLREWAHDTLRARDPETYRRKLIDLYRAGKSAARLSMLNALADMDPKDATLARLGIRDESARVRIAAAGILWELEPAPEVQAAVHAVARDKSLRDYDEFLARTTAMEALTWGEEPMGAPEKILETLTAVLLDESDDVVARGSAALALGYLGDKRAIPALRKAFSGKVPEKPVYLHSGPDWADDEMLADMRSVEHYLQTDDVRMDSARALGILRAREAAPALIAYLDAPEKEYEHNLRPAVADALARIAAPEARKVLAKQRDAQKNEEDAAAWQRRIDLLDALNGKQPASDLLKLLADGYDDPRWVEIALAEVAGDAELEALAREQPDFADVIEAARKRKRDTK